jgi:hypothetical protein
MTTVPLAQSSLLQHLGITMHYAEGSGPWGDEQIELHVFARHDTMSQVLAWVGKARLQVPVRVFEGSPPPF